MSSSSNSSINITFTTEKSSDSPKLPTPTPTNEPHYRWGNYHTGYTPDSKKAKRALFSSPDTKRKIDDIHHYQSEQIALQKELYFEQKVTASRLSLLEKMIYKFCGPKLKDVSSPLPIPSDPIDPSASYRTEEDPVNLTKKFYSYSPQRPSYSPNSWEKNYNANEGKSYTTPTKTPPSSK